MDRVIPIIIPSLEPSECLIELVNGLRNKLRDPIVIVDDGSGEAFQSIFTVLENVDGCYVIHHTENKGKGRALKTAFQFCLEKFPGLIGSVTADADGQHTVDCIVKCRKALASHQGSLIMGVRDFSLENVPKKSRLGNNITKFVCKAFCGINVSDTQTGLRGIPAEFMGELISVKGERFEFETRMLLAAKGNYPIFEVQIETVYDSKENHSTHFNTVKDSVRIYKIFLSVFAKFMLSSMSASAIDLILFAVLCTVFQDMTKYYVILSTVLARSVSATYNYLINYRVVFHSHTSHKKTTARYFCLAVMLIILSACAVTGLTMLLPNLTPVIAKVPVDILLFFLNFFVQREFIYRKKK